MMFAISIRCSDGKDVRCGSRLWVLFGPVYPMDRGRLSEARLILAFPPIPAQCKSLMGQTGNVVIPQPATYSIAIFRCANRH
jgi:hypothetical protein